MFGTQVRWVVLMLVAVLTCCKIQGQKKNKYLNKEYWKDQGLKDVLPYWSAKAVDSVNGMFYPSLDRNWQPFGNDEQSSAMISRHLFGYTAGYLMSGDEKLFRRAKEIKNYLVSNCWDKQYGGWYDGISREGKPSTISKTTFAQVYVITGLTLYYFATKDPEVLRYVDSSNQLLEKKVWDSKAEGYYDVMNRDWTIKSDSKSFSSEITPVSGYLFYLYLATRDEKYMKQTVKILDVVLRHMRGASSGWILESFDSNWQYNAQEKSINEVNIGHNIETAWMLLRAYLINGNKNYLKTANELAAALNQYGFNKQTGIWYANVSKDSSANHRALSYWWIQAYGNMFNLNLYRIDPQPEYLENFCIGSQFWDEYFIDEQMGDSYQGVSITGEPVDSAKATPYKASYHNMENALLNWLYTGLWVKKEPVTLYFNVTSSKAGDKLYPLPVEEEKYIIERVVMGGKVYENGRKNQSFITLPDLQETEIEVTVRPAN